MAYSLGTLVGGLKHFFSHTHTSQAHSSRLLLPLSLSLSPSSSPPYEYLPYSITIMAVMLSLHFAAIAASTSFADMAWGSVPPRTTSTAC